jgi:hypothetical protein
MDIIELIISITVPVSFGANESFVILLRPIANSQKQQLSCNSINMKFVKTSVRWIAGVLSY